MKGLRRTSSPRAGETEERIAIVLSDVAPLLRIEHCSLQLEHFDAGSGELVIAIHGSCPDCTGSPAMFATAIGAHVRQRIPEVREVRLRES